MNTKLVCIVLGAAMSAACAKKTGPVEEPVAAAQPASKDASVAAAKAVPEQISRMIANFKRVHFSFDSSDLTSESRAALAENTSIMSAHPDIRVEVQGHCDERGTTDYNLSLGQKRAESIRKYMATAGVSSSRIATVSYGKERPLAKGTGDTVWSENRRAEFRITWNQDQVAGVEGTVK